MEKSQRPRFAAVSLSVAEVVQVGRWIAGQKPNASVRAETVQRYLASVVPPDPADGVHEDV